MYVVVFTVVVFNLKLKWEIYYYFVRIPYTHTVDSYDILYKIIEYLVP